jgi:putative transposase
VVEAAPVTSTGGAPRKARVRDTIHRVWLNEFAERWDEKYPSIAKSWRANWVRIIPIFAYSAEIRKAIYTTNAIESVNFSLRKLTKIRGSFPNDEAALKLLYLGLRNISKRWTMPIPNWKKSLNQFMIKFEDRLTTA